MSATHLLNEAFRHLRGEFTSRGNDLDHLDASI